MAQVKFIAVAAAAALLLAAGAARADGDPKKGEKIFKANLCFSCHKFEAGKHGAGPSLHGVFGRKAGGAEGFAYSDALKNSGLVWNEDNLKKWVAGPPELVPGTKMVLPKAKYVTKEDDAEDLIAYIKQESSK